MAEHVAAAAGGERQYTDFDRALVAGDLYWTEERRYSYIHGAVLNVTLTHPPSLFNLNLHLPRLVADHERRMAAVAAVNPFGVPVTEWRIAVRTTLIDGTHKVPLTPGSHVMVNRPCKVPLHTPIVIRKGTEEAAGLYWADAADYGLTRRELAMYEKITARMAQITAHCAGGISRDERRELEYLDLLRLHAHPIHARILRKHATWLRRRHAIAAMARITALPAPAPAAGRVGEW